MKKYLITIILVFVTQQILFFTTKSPGQSPEICEVVSIQDYNNDLDLLTLKPYISKINAITKDFSIIDSEGVSLSVENSEASAHDEEIYDSSEHKTNSALEVCDLPYRGEFVCTAYCNCSICCGKWSGYPLPNGNYPQPNHTIATDTSVIPRGTTVYIDGIYYVAEDTGSAIKGNRIDIYFGSHEEALAFGKQTKSVYY